MTKTLEPTENKKDYYRPHVQALVGRGQRPVHEVFDSGQHKEERYSLGSLPHGKIAVYAQGRIFVSSGIEHDYPAHEADCGSYTSGLFKKMLGMKFDASDRQMVLAARQLIKEMDKDPHEVTKAYWAEVQAGKDKVLAESKLNPPPEIGTPMTEREREQLRQHQLERRSSREHSSDLPLTVLEREQSGLEVTSPPIKSADIEAEL